MSLQHDLPLISTIAISFTAAFVCGLIASKMRLSPIVGYLTAGILIGPHTPGLEANTQIAEELSEIGILLLMFGVGLHFSVKDLMAVRRIALPGAIIKIILSTLLTAFIFTYVGWTFQTGLMLGLALSVASTVVLLRALEEHDLLQSTNGHIAIGWLIIEDIAMVLALVMIPALASNSDVNGGLPLQELLIAIGKVCVFVAFMLVAGKRFLPWLLMTVARTHSRELFTVAVFAVAMGVAFGAAKLFGISIALGAFLAGMMIRESDLSQEVAEKALPLQDAFAVLFFVSVGMLFNPSILVEQPLQVFLVVLIITVGKTIISGITIILFRYPLKTVLLVSAGLAQIGEFSFVLAGLGVHYGILPESGRDLILAGALISISLNPGFFYTSRLIYEWVARHPKASKLFDMRDDDLLHLESKQQLKETVIMVGHGRVGAYITQNLRSTSIDLVIIDTNRERIEELREQGFYAIVGDATHANTLREAAIEKASTIIVGVPNPFEAKRIVEAARQIAPDIKVLVRAQNDAEMNYFNANNVDLAVMGPREVGRRMVEYLQNPIK